MIATIYISGKIGEDTTLLDVIRQFKSYEEPTEVLAIIDSNGGVKEDGDSIYDYLEGLKKEMSVNTYAKKAYSIAAKIFAVGEKRSIDDIDKALLIHFAWAKPNAGTADYFEAVAAELRKMEDEFSLFYSDFLSVDEDTARNLLKNETCISGADAITLGFATELKATELKAVAEYTSVINLNTKKMNETKTKTKSKGQILLDAMAAFVGLPVNAELTLQDSNAVDIVFPDLESGDIPKKGDKATIDGVPVSDGSYIMPSMEESTIKFEGGVITEITEKETETETTSPAETLEVNAEEVQEISIWTMNVLNTTFAVGDKVTREGWEEGTEESVGSGEFQLSDGRRVVTDSLGVIVLIKEAEALKEVPLDAEANFDELIKKVTSKVRAEIQTEFDGKLTEKENEIKELKSKIGSEEFHAEEKENINNNKLKNKSWAEILQTKEKK